MHLHKLVCAESALLLAFTIVCAPQDVTIKKVPIKRVAAHSGEGMYTNYCAVCHGKDGTGNGPFFFDVKSFTEFFTTLAKQNNGKFPDSHVYTVIRGDANMPASHGTQDMPVWAALFTESCGANPSEAEVHQRISNLTKHVESLQGN